MIRKNAKVVQLDCGAWCVRDFIREQGVNDYGYLHPDDKWYLEPCRYPDEGAAAERLRIARERKRPERTCPKCWQPECEHTDKKRCDMVYGRRGWRQLGVYDG